MRVYITDNVEISSDEESSNEENFNKETSDEGNFSEE